uniref:GCN5-related N-acetyltransferase n=1 Tax=Sphingobacterium sp. (strain 21) TaxID=743722 RepID=F4C2Q9_SPHS2
MISLIFIFERLKFQIWKVYFGFNWIRMQIIWQHLRQKIQLIKVHLEKYTKLLNDPTVNNFTIVVDGIIVGSVAKFVMEGNAEITYWIDKKYWKKGITSYALKHFLAIETTRPIFARVAFDNFGSRRVLEKCGFVKIGTDRGYANARQLEIEEFIYRLDNF